jgi:hypothetical protein
MTNPENACSRKHSHFGVLTLGQRFELLPGAWRRSRSVPAMLIRM